MKLAVLRNEVVRCSVGKRAFQKSSSNRKFTLLSLISRRLY